MPTSRRLLVRRRDLAARRTASRIAARRRRPRWCRDGPRRTAAGRRTHDVGPEPVHRQRGLAARREPLVEIGERRRADHEDRVAVGEQRVRARIAGVVRVARAHAANDRSAPAARRPRATPTANRAAASPASKPRTSLRQTTTSRGGAVSAIASARRSGATCGADKRQRAGGDRRLHERKPRQFALRDEAAGAIDDHPLAIADAVRSRVPWSRRSTAAGAMPRQPLTG